MGTEATQSVMSQSLPWPGCRPLRLKGLRISDMIDLRQCGGDVMCTKITSFKVFSDDTMVVHNKCVGNNDVFVTIQLGKEKYQTSTIKNAHNPEWFEECDLPIPHLHSEIEVSVYHRGMLSDDFLGYATIPLWEQKIQDTSKTQSV
ncbi:hypothetical protein ACOMHN_032635 [Nucella lapillus]